MTDEANDTIGDIKGRLEQVQDNLMRSLEPLIDRKFGGATRKTRLMIIIVQIILALMICAFLFNNWKKLEATQDAIENLGTHLNSMDLDIESAQSGIDQLLDDIQGLNSEMSSVTEALAVEEVSSQLSSLRSSMTEQYELVSGQIESLDSVVVCFVNERQDTTIDSELSEIRESVNALRLTVTDLALVDSSLNVLSEAIEDIRCRIDSMHTVVLSYASDVVPNNAEARNDSAVIELMPEMIDSTLFIQWVMDWFTQVDGGQDSIRSRREE